MHSVPSVLENVKTASLSLMANRARCTPAPMTYLVRVAAEVAYPEPPTEVFAVRDIAGLSSNLIR